jgi:RNA-directed DNA polymerase
VTQDNQGKNTAGVDGIKAIAPKQRIELVEQLHPNHWKAHPSRPVRRVWIPKPGKLEKRPLGIPVMRDRAHQCLATGSLLTRVRKSCKGRVALPDTAHQVATEEQEVGAV